MIYDKPLRLKNRIQEYDWGSRTAIRSLLGLSVPGGKPIAEIWMGAHPKAPSEVEINGIKRSLDKLIAEDPVSILGKKVVDKFSHELPFLFKVIAAEKPLSIQVHPNKDQAISGFNKENALGIPLSAPERNYKDKNHKPEILCAITKFEALKGFRKIEEMILLMERVVPSVLKRDLAALKERQDFYGLRSFYTSIMKMDEDKKTIAIRELVDKAKLYQDVDPAYSLVLKLNEIFPMDIGVFSPLVLNRITLGVGEAIYLPAGELHAYISGVGVELMANSDNVLRGGLTHKHVDVDELLNIVKFNYGPAQIITPIDARDCEAIYTAPAEEFILSVIKLENGKNFISLDENRPAEIMILIDGEAEIRDVKKGNILKLKKGDSILIPSAMPQYIISGVATIYKASVPV